MLPSPIQIWVAGHLGYFSCMAAPYLAIGKRGCHQRMGEPPAMPPCAHWNQCTILMACTGGDDPEKNRERTIPPVLWGDLQAFVVPMACCFAFSRCGSSCRGVCVVATTSVLRGAAGSSSFMLDRWCKLVQSAHVAIQEWRTLFLQGFGGLHRLLCRILWVWLVRILMHRWM